MDCLEENYSQEYSFFLQCRLMYGTQIKVNNIQIPFCFIPFTRNSFYSIR